MPCSHLDGNCWQSLSLSPAVRPCALTLPALSRVVFCENHGRDWHRNYRRRYNEPPSGGKPAMVSASRGVDCPGEDVGVRFSRSEEHTSELQSLMRISYAVFCLKKKNKQTREQHIINTYSEPKTI